jgi:predicted O-methyltransferase YrrM
MASSSSGRVLEKIERAARTQYLPIIGPERGKALAEVVRAVKPKRVLEVGTLVGYSTILIARELEDDAEIVTIEIDEDEAATARQNIREADVKPKVQVIVGDASEIIPNLNGEFDLVFLDGDKHVYLQQLKLVEDKLHKGSAVIADNVGYHYYGIRNYLDYVRSSSKYESRLVRVGGDGIEVSTKL